jgi:hypothetical protein
MDQNNIPNHNVLKRASAVLMNLEDLYGHLQWSREPGRGMEDLYNLQRTRGPRRELEGLYHGYRNRGPGRGLENLSRTRTVT